MLRWSEDEPGGKRVDVTLLVYGTLGAIVVALGLGVATAAIAGLLWLFSFGLGLKL